MSGYKQGNPMWKRLPSMAGNAPKYLSPEHLYHTACEYFDWCDRNPLYQNGVYGKDCNEMAVEKPRPYTIAGLALYLGMHRQSIKDMAKAKPDFAPVIELIENIIGANQLEGACAGLFNPNIIARVLGLADKKEVENTGEIKHVQLYVPDNSRRVAPPKPIELKEGTDFKVVDDL